MRKVKLDNTEIQKMIKKKLSIKTYYKLKITSKKKKKQRAMALSLLSEPF